MYESAERRFVNAYLDPTLDVIELGASLGVMTCHIARKLSAGHRVIALEANPHLFDSIRRNVARNVPATEIELVQGAIDYGVSGDTATFSVNANHLASSLKGKGGEVVSVPAWTVRELRARYNLGRYNLVCDIEGAEAGIAFADKGELDGCERAIIELHETTYNGQVITVDDLANQLAKAHGLRELARYGPVIVLGRDE